MTEEYAEETSFTAVPDVSKKVIDINWPEDLSDVYFLKLELKNDSGEILSGNFYWLSVNGDEKADFTALNNLPQTDLDVSISSIQKEGNTYTVAVDLENPSSSLAFSINPKIVKSESKDLVLPIYWEDNYFSLLPREKRSVKVDFNAEILNGEKPVLQIEGWNINPQDMVIE
jgi:hypothetical protein